LAKRLHSSHQKKAALPNFLTLQQVPCRWRHHAYDCVAGCVQRTLLHRGNGPLLAVDTNIWFVFPGDVSNRKSVCKDALP
jgi:hypothetical protein